MAFVVPAEIGHANCGFLRCSLCSDIERHTWDAASPAIACFGTGDQILAGLGYTPRLD
jgi:hypothetical protein